MTEDLRRDLRELPPLSLDVPTDFYDRVMTTARRRQRVMRAGSASLAAAVVAAVVVVSVSLAATSSTARLVPVTPPPSPSTSAPSPSPTPTTTPTPSQTPSPSAVSPSPPATSAVVVPPPSPSTSAPVAVSYPPLTYADLPYPGCPSGYDSYGNPGLGSQFCIPPAYVPQENFSCPAGSHETMGPALCMTDGNATVVEPVANPSLPPISLASTPRPACQNGYVAAGTLGTVAGALHCVPAAYLPGAANNCPAGSQFATDPAPLCFTSATKDTIVAAAPTS